MTDYFPKWHRELEIFCKIKPLIMLEGNVLDMYQYPEEGSTPKGSILRLPEYLHFFFKDRGYSNVVFYDSLRGFYNFIEEGYLQRFGDLVNQKIADGFIKSEFKARGLNAVAHARSVMTQTKEASVIIMDFASRYITSPDNMEQSDVDSFTVLLQASLEAKEVKTESYGVLKNILILIVNKSNDIPAWFYLLNPNNKIVSISKPAKEEREQLVKGSNFPSFFAGDIYMEDHSYFKEHPDELNIRTRIHKQESVI